jgi:hypothetical protein
MLERILRHSSNVSNLTKSCSLDLEPCISLTSYTHGWDSHRRVVERFAPTRGIHHLLKQVQSAVAEHDLDIEALL